MTYILRRLRESTIDWDRMPMNDAERPVNLTCGDIRVAIAEIKRLRATLSVITARDCYSHDEVVAMARVALNHKDQEP